jgi:hypothetical protein
VKLRSRGALPVDPSASLTPQQELTEALRSHLYQERASGPRGVESCWVMSFEWFKECRQLETESYGPLWDPSLAATGPVTLLGIPVEIRKDGGVPHLEPA